MRPIFAPFHGGSNEALLANHHNAFFRLFRDVNGDGKVNITDVAAFRLRKGMANYRWYFDHNGVTNRTLAAQFLQRYDPQLVLGGQDGEVGQRLRPRTSTVLWAGGQRATGRPVANLPRKAFRQPFLPQ
jgi:hypothetical protein